MVPLPLQSETKGNWHVSVVIGPGSSVEHFHHFLLGFFVPIIYQLSTSWAKAKFNHLIVRSCGPLDPLLREFGHDRIQIIDKDRHRQMAEDAVHSSPTSTDMLAIQDAKLNFLTIHGCDFPVAYDKRKFAKVREVLLSIETIRSEIRSLADHWPRGDARIILVQRGPSHSYYHSERSEIKGAGQDRRSIANHGELYRSIRQDYVGCLNVVPEKLSLTRQVALFWLADIIIAQHGAALANVVWTRPSTTVIEISPRHIGVRANDFFLNLSRCMGLRHRRVWQDHAVGDVDIDKIHRIVAKAIAAPQHPVISLLRSAAFRIYRPAIPIRRELRSLIREVLGEALRLGRRLSRAFGQICSRY